MQPLTLFIEKIVSRCNLDCDYCYVYHSADQSWRSQPHRMLPQTVTQVARRIGEHAAHHNLSVVEIVLHGGEPLLAGHDFIRTMCEITRKEIVQVAPNTSVRFGMQTNGALFNDATLKMCLDWNIGIGLSLDGPRVANDRHRLDHGGHSSLEAVERAVEQLKSPQGRRIWSGFLTVIDIHNDPIEVYDYLQSHQPPSIEFLLPLNHYDERPYGKAESLDTTPYADWLLPIFNKWYHQVPQRTNIRRFRDIIALMAGSNSSTEEWGLQPVDFILVETNGEIQGVDSLKVTYEGANHLGLNVFDHSFDDALASPAVIERQQGLSALCSTCQQCKLVRVCGGGYFPHRYSKANGFQNPSVYCADLKKLIRTIHATVVEDIRRLKQDGTQAASLTVA